MTEFNKEENVTPPISQRDLSKRRPFMLPSMKAHAIFWPITVGGIALDLWTKKAIFGWLRTVPDRELFVIDGFFKLVMAENAGAAFGIATGQRHSLVAVSILALIVIIGFFLFSGTKGKLMHVALGLFVAGVSGNLYDRVFNNGLVRDFIDVKYWPGRSWPAFNVADSMLCIGVGLLIISSLQMPKRPAPTSEVAVH